MAKKRGRGYPRKTTEQFIAQSKAKFGEKFDYTPTAYIDARTMVVIGCPIHGNVSVWPRSHLRSPIGCPKCSGKYLKSTLEFEANGKRFHGDRFDYSVSDYKGASKPISIKCRKHGIVFQISAASNHFSQVHGGCPECDKESMSMRFRKPISNVGINDGEINAIHTRIYQIWHGMIMRCHNEKTQETHNNYRGVIVCDEWLNFSSFLKWVESPESGYKDGYELDKDILSKGRKIYSPQTCCFVHPRTILR